MGSQQKAMKEVKLLSSLLLTLTTLLLFLLDPAQGFFPRFRPYTFRRRPARPQNPIYVSADRVSKGSDRVIGTSNRREQESLVILSNPHGSGGECRRIITAAADRSVSGDW